MHADSLSHKGNTERGRQSIVTPKAGDTIRGLL
jgi:hypothetical protein